MKRNKWTTRLCCGALVGITLVGAAVAAGSQGSQSNPLVTLSYLTDTAVPDILRQVDERIDQRAQELEKTLQQRGQLVFVAVEVPQGKTLTLSAGSQLLFRSGRATCIDGLIDTTEGAVLGGWLTEDHLYIATGDGQKVTAPEASTFMVLGEWQVD